MTIEILHRISFPLPNPPTLPATLSTYIQRGDFFSPDEFQIRGDIRGAPTLEILDELWKKGARVASPIWDLAFQGEANNACAFKLGLSSAGSRRNVDLLNPCDDWVYPEAAPMDVQLSSDRDAILNKSPQGPVCVLGNNLLVASSVLDTLQLTPTATVLVKGKPVSWHVVQPPVHSVFDPLLCFCRPDERPYRAHLANIAKADAPLNFGVATEMERYDTNNRSRFFLIDLESAARIMPPNRITFGDLELEPVYSADSPEAQMVRAITERMNRLIEWPT